jgi:hypothetical protein
MHSRVMTWQTHYSGHALSPPPTGRDVSEDTQIELVLPEHSYVEVELKVILSLFAISVIFNTLDLLKIKEHH